MSDERDSASPPPTPATKTRRVVDVDPDDDDEGWQDEEELLQGLGTTTHRSRNRAMPVIPVRRHRPRVVAGANVRATARKRRGEKTSKMAQLASDLNDWEVEREERAQELAERHGIKVKEVRRRMLASSVFKPKRKVSLYNAKISRLMKTLNAGMWTLFSLFDCLY